MTQSVETAQPNSFLSNFEILNLSPVVEPELLNTESSLPVADADPDPDLSLSVSLPVAATPGVGSRKRLRPNADDSKVENAKSLQQLDYYKKKAFQQDVEIFEMRALLQSGKGFSNILNLRQLLETFMAVVREKYSVVNTAVLLKDDLENTQDYYRVKAHHGLDERFLHPSGMEESI
ncbi:MAG: hypothetical protein ACK5AC_19550 [Planctomycetota bacterium]